MESFCDKQTIGLGCVMITDYNDYDFHAHDNHRGTEPKPEGATANTGWEGDGRGRTPKLRREIILGHQSWEEKLFWVQIILGHQS